MLRDKGFDGVASCSFADMTVKENVLKAYISKACSQDIYFE